MQSIRKNFQTLRKSVGDSVSVQVKSLYRRQIKARIKLARISVFKPVSAQQTRQRHGKGFAVENREQHGFDKISAAYGKAFERKDDLSYFAVGARADIGHSERLHGLPAESLRNDAEQKRFSLAALKNASLEIYTIACLFGIRPHLLQIGLSQRYEVVPPVVGVHIREKRQRVVGQLCSQSVLRRHLEGKNAALVFLAFLQRKPFKARRRVGIPHRKQLGFLHGAAARGYAHLVLPRLRHNEKIIPVIWRKNISVDRHLRFAGNLAVSRSHRKAQCVRRRVLRDKRRIHLESLVKNRLRQG